jgi:hypothetical protein
MNVSMPADRKVPQKIAETKTQGFMYRDTMKLKYEINIIIIIIIINNNNNNNMIQLISQNQDTE